MEFTWYDGSGRRLVKADVSILAHGSTHGTTDPIPSGAALDIVQSASEPGAAAAYSRSDHLHFHGLHSRSDLHAPAFPGVAGFLSGADKSRLDALKEERIVLAVRNPTGSTIAKGKAVAVTGYFGTFPLGLYEVGLADKDDPALRPALGVALENISSVSTGKIIVVGIISGIDSSSFALTDQLVLGTAGALIRPPPETFPFTGEIQLIAHVTRAHATEGEVYVNAQGLIPDENLEIVEYLPQPETGYNGEATRSAGTNYEGAAFVLRRGIQANRILLNVSAVPTAGNLALAIYQAGLGGSGTATKVGSVASFAVSSTGVKTLTFDEGDIELDEGLYYLLWGKSSGNFSLSAYATDALVLANGAGVDNATHPSMFTTSLPTTSIPATFNPLPTGGGGQATASTADVGLEHRFRKI